MSKHVWPGDVPYAVLGLWCHPALEREGRWERTQGETGRGAWGRREDRWRLWFLQLLKRIAWRQLRPSGLP